MSSEGKEIIEIYTINKDQGLDILVQNFKSPLYKFSLHLCKNKNEADDLFQDTWVKVFKNLDKYDENKSIQTWIFTICMNSYRDKYAKSKRWLNIIKDYFNNEAKEDELKNIETNDHLPEEEALKNIEKEMVRRAVENLKEDFKIPIILYYFQGFSYKEISQILNIPEGTIKSRLNKGRQLIKDYLEVNYNG